MKVFCKWECLCHASTSFSVSWINCMFTGNLRDSGADPVAQDCKRGSLTPFSSSFSNPANPGAYQFPP